MSDPHNPRGMSVTLKGEGKDPTWLVFHGSPASVKEDIIEAFNLTGEFADLSLHELQVEATRIHKATANVSRVLGGRPVPASSESSTAAWNDARAEPVVPVVNPLIERIASLTTVPEVRDLYARNEAEFKADADLLALWKAKGKELAAATAAEAAVSA